MIRALKLAALATLATLACIPAANAYTTTRKFHPGHYTVLFMSDNVSQKAMHDANRSGMTGIVKKYYWRDLEPTQGNYKFDAIQADLNWAQAYGMQLVIMIVDKTFKLERPNPAYLDAQTPRNRAGGYTIVRWNPTVVSRYKALVAAMGNRFDSHANFEGIAVQETSLGLDSPVLKAFGYTPEKYRDASIESYGYALSVMPRSRVFWYQNYFVGNQTYIGTGIPGLGKLVVIKHDNGFITVYAHNKDIVVKEQQAVARGQKIAEIGSTDADRPKLHFQIRKGSAAVDPMRYLPAS